MSISLTAARAFALVLLIVVFASPAVGADAAKGAGLWGTAEVRSTDLTPFRKWTTAVARFHREEARPVPVTCGRGSAGCAVAAWRQFLSSVRGMSRFEALTAVNRYVNRRPYVSDETNWHEADHWATPGEFFDRSGDCEDFAIVKYWSLRQLGWSDAELRIVAVHDLEKGIGHAVLVAFLNGRAYVLDNLIAEVTDTALIHHYRPVFSINASAWWYHTARPQA